MSGFTNQLSGPERNVHVTHLTSTFSLLLRLAFRPEIFLFSGSFSYFFPFVSDRRSRLCGRNSDRRYRRPRLPISSRNSRLRTARTRTYLSLVSPAVAQRVC